MREFDCCHKRNHNFGFPHCFPYSWSAFLVDLPGLHAAGEEVVMRAQKIIHITTVHPRTDTRIRVKEAATLARIWPGEVALYVQDGKGDETDAQVGVVVHDTGPPERGRLRRMTRGAFRMYRAVRRARPRIAHFHDPELLPWAMLLRLQGMKVVYDVHENVPAQIESKDWLPKLLKPLLVVSVKLFDKLAALWFDQIVLAEPVYLKSFPPGKALVVHNYPILNEFHRIANTGK